MEERYLNRLKVVLVEKRKTGVWLAEELGVSPITISNGAQIKPNHPYKHLTRLQTC